MLGRLIVYDGKLMSRCTKVFKSIIAFEDETEDFPLGALRTEYEPNYLKRVDGQMNKLIEDYKMDVLAACEEILRAFPEMQTDEWEEG